jgi:hypothetical protein
VPYGTREERQAQTDFRFGQLGVQKRRENGVLVGGAVSGTKIVGVVGVDAVGDRCKSARAAKSFHARKEFILAVVTTVGGIRHVEWIIEFARLDELVADAGNGDEGERSFAIVPGVARGKRSHRQSPTAQNGVCGPRQVGGIRAARKSNQQGIERTESVEKPVLFGDRGAGVRRG